MASKQQTLSQNVKRNLSEGEKQYLLSMFDGMVLLLNVARGSRHPNVGFEDTDNSEAQLRALIGQGRSIAIEKSALESALWSCNLLDEQKAFEHPDGKSFDDFLNSILEPRGRGEKFDKIYNLIIPKGTKND